MKQIQYNIIFSSCWPLCRVLHLGNISVSNGEKQQQQQQKPPQQQQPKNTTHTTHTHTDVATFKGKYSYNDLKFMFSLQCTYRHSHIHVSALQNRELLIY